ncbi:unnamed protein product [Amoebophrya sp. A25]|nr:unnamed protein product [Amoebophrya sp. A25]|eukprot:GSA25T00004451001.1
MIRLDGFNEGTTLQELLQEISIMAELDHPNVIKVFEYFTGPTRDRSTRSLQVIMELCQGGELWDRFPKYESAPAAEKERWVFSILIQILRALAFMHDSVRIAHKDLKPENVLFLHRESESLRIIDFGLAEKFKMGQSKSDQQCGTPLFSAPEILSEKEFDFKVDVWSCGVMMYHMLENRGPFPAKTLTELKQMVCTNAYAIPRPGRNTRDLSSDCIDCCFRMLSRDPRDRPRASDVLKKDPWLLRMSRAVEDGGMISPGVCQILENYHRQSELKKAVYLFIVYFYFNASLNKLAEPVRVLFTYLDLNNTGRIQQEDIRQVLSRAGLHSRALAGGIAHSLCRRKGATDVAFSEFLAAICSIRISTRQHELIRLAFLAFDKGSKGYLLPADLVRVCAGGRDTSQDDELRQLISAEFPGRDRISYDDFLAKMRSVGATQGGDQLMGVA